MALPDDIDVPRAKSWTGVDDHLWEPTDEEIEHLELWTQGCLIKGTALRWTESATASSDTYIDTDGWMVVLSQTCDISARAIGAKHPWVLASPAQRVADEKLELVSNWQVGYLVPLAVGDGEAWVADLRIVAPIHKRVLARCNPIDGFATPDDALRFADFVAMKFRRPAFDSVISDGVRKILDKELGRAKHSHWIGAVEQVRVEVRPNRLRPGGVIFHVLSDRELQPAEIEVLKNAFADVGKLLKDVNIVMSTRYDVVDRFPVRTYRNSASLQLKSLSGPPWW